MWCVDTVLEDYNPLIGEAQVCGSSETVVARRVGAFAGTSVKSYRENLKSGYCSNNGGAVVIKRRVDGL